MFPRDEASKGMLECGTRDLIETFIREYTLNFSSLCCYYQTCPMVEEIAKEAVFTKGSRFPHLDTTMRKQASRSEIRNIGINFSSPPIFVVFLIICDLVLERYYQLYKRSSIRFSSIFLIIPGVVAGHLSQRRLLTVILILFHL